MTTQTQYKRVETLNVPLLEKIRDHILEEPKRFDMSIWGKQLAAFEINPEIDPPCGTTACLAGWANFFNPEGAASFNNSYRAMVALGIYEFSIDDENDDHPLSARRLFHDYRWEAPYGRRYQKAEEISDRAGMAQTAADYIDYLIANYGPSNKE